MSISPAASRFACLPDDESADWKAPKSKGKPSKNDINNSKNLNDNKPKDKAKLKAQQEAKALQNLAFGGQKKAKNKKKNKGAGGTGGAGPGLPPGPKASSSESRLSLGSEESPMGPEGSPVGAQQQQEEEEENGSLGVSVSPPSSPLSSPHLAGVGGVGVSPPPGEKLPCGTQPRGDPSQERKPTGCGAAKVYKHPRFKDRAPGEKLVQVRGPQGGTRPGPQVQGPGPQVQGPGPQASCVPPSLEPQAGGEGPREGPRPETDNRGQTELKPRGPPVPGQPNPGLGVLLPTQDEMLQNLLAHAKAQGLSPGLISSPVLAGGYLPTNGATPPPNGAKARDMMTTEAELVEARAEIGSLTEKLAQAKLRSKKVTEILMQAEMKEKTEVIVQLHKLETVRDELSTQLSLCLAEREAERSLTLTAIDRELKPLVGQILTEEARARILKILNPAKN